jgi:hypothetical protein
MKSQRLVFGIHGKPADVLCLESFETPPLADGEVLLAVHAAPINPADLNFIEGNYGIKPELPAHAGMECAGWWPVTTNPHVLAGFRKRLPDLPEVADRERLLDDPSIQLILSAAIPNERAALAIEAMRRGKDVLVDKPGITTHADLAAVEAAVAETGRRFMVAFGDRWASPASAKAKAAAALCEHAAHASGPIVFWATKSSAPLPRATDADVAAAPRALRRWLGR